MTTPRVSIVIPGYNAEKYIDLTLESVQAQTLADWEVVALDDGSRDGTAEVCRVYAARDPRIRALRQENAGIAAARNRAFAETDPRADYVLFLDNDDLLEPEALETLAAALDAAPEHVSAHGLARCIDPAGGFPPGDDLEARLRERRVIRNSRAQAVPEEAPTTFEALLAYNNIVSPGVHLMRRRAVETVGGFDPATVPCDDWDLSLRLSRLGPIAYVPRVLLLWRRHEANASDRSGRWRHAYYAVWRKTLSSRDNTPEQRRMARAVYLRICREEHRGVGVGLRRGRVRLAARQCARAAYSYAQYLRARFA